MMTWGMVCAAWACGFGDMACRGVVWRLRACDGCRQCAWRGVGKLFNHKIDYIIDAERSRL